MKRLHLFLTILAFIIGCLGAHAERWNYQADAVAICTYNDRYNRWNNWSSWTPCDVIININGDNDKITIYSDVVQVYKIYSVSSGEYDRDGDYHVDFEFRDQDGDYGTLCIYKRRNGGVELYVRFNNVQWVYDIRV